MWHYHGSQFGLEFYAGWLTEYSLSVDNLFIFIIMASFKVPRITSSRRCWSGSCWRWCSAGCSSLWGRCHPKVLVDLLLFPGAFLVFTAVKARPRHRDTATMRTTRWSGFKTTYLNSTDTWHGLKLYVKRGGKRVMTPMFLVIVALATTDLLFAFDSIPAIYGLTKEPYLVFAANVFALMGLRQLYFLIGDLLGRLIYLSQGLAFILFFIGVKLLLHPARERSALHQRRTGRRRAEMPTLLSLAVIVLTLFLTMVASLIKTRFSDSR